MRSIVLGLFLFGASTAGAQFQESITVERVLLDVRVTTYDGEPVTGLAAEDFSVTVGGKSAEIVSVTWIPEGEAAIPIPLPDEAPAFSAPAMRTPQGRLFVVFVQTDFARERLRVQGHLSFLSYAKKMIEALDPADRVAVFSFDSHLKFRLDFSDDKQAVIRALEQTLKIDAPPPPPIVPSPSLASRLDPAAMRKAAHSETALLLLGNALRSIEGPKSLLLLGWGLGERSGGVVRMKKHWVAARNSLEAARVTIFALDTTHADYHDLEIGLSRAARDTGGFYAKTHVFPQIAIDRLRRTLIGRYELELRRPAALRPGTHDVRVRVKRRGADVLAPSTWMDR